MSKLIIVALLLACLYDGLSAKKMKESKDKKAPKRRIGDIVEDLEKKVTELWDKVEQLSNPVHVHVHGDGHVMEDCHHGSHEGHNHSANVKGGNMGHHSVHNHSVHNHSDVHGHHDDQSRHGLRHTFSPGGPLTGRHHHDDVDDDDDDDDKAKKRKKEKTTGQMSDESSKDDKMDDNDEDFHHDPKGAHVHIHLHTGSMDHDHHHHHDDDHDHHHHHDDDRDKQRGPLPNEYRYARCDVVGNSALPSSQRQNITGSIYFRQKPGGSLDIELHLRGFQLEQGPGASQTHVRAMHGHEYGDLSEGCVNMGGHFNPWGTLHGGPDSRHRHSGDFGNIEVEQDGTSDTSFSDSKGGSLFGDDSLLGRGIVIHAGRDDHGEGESEASKQSGNAGARIACCVIVATAQPAAVWDD